MKNFVIRTSSRSSGRSTAPTTQNQSSRSEIDDDACADTARPSQAMQRISTLTKNVKVRPVPSSPHSPEHDDNDETLVNSRLRLPSNQRADLETHKGDIVRTVGSEPRSSTRGTELSIEFRRSKENRNTTRSVMLSTLQISKTSAVRIVRGASRGRGRERKTSEQETEGIKFRKVHKSKGDSLESDGGARRGKYPTDRTNSVRWLSQRETRSSPSFSEYVTNALVKMQVEPQARRVMSPIPPEVAWKHLLVVPSSPFWVLWNSLHLLALGYICTVVPYMTALPSLALGKPGDCSDAVNRAIDVFYLLDVVVNFRACYIDSETGEVVTDPRCVAKHYVASSVAWFMFDIVMAFPFDLLLGSDAVGSTMTFTFVRILRLVRLAKLLRILKLRPIIDFCEDNLGVSRNKLIVVQLIATIAFVAHLTACGFILAATVGPSVVSTGDHAAIQPTQRSWIDVNDLADAPSSEIYVAALYWAFTMMTTVGFGDIVPKTLAERVYSILAMVISAGTYAYVIASMSTIVALMNLQQSRYYERINELNAYMASRQLPPGLQLRTRQFFRYYLTKKSVFDEHALFDVLPQNLREELVEHHVKTAMHHIHFFQELKERGFIGHIAFYLRPVFFPPTSVIVKAHDHATEMFFISKGVCEVVVVVSHATVSPQHSPSRKSRLSPTKALAQLVSPLRGLSPETHNEWIATSLRDGDYFGEMALLCDAPRHRRFASVRAVTFCELHSLSYAHLAPALDKYPSVWKQMSVAAHARRVVLEELGGQVLPGDHTTRECS